jgi:hypothetical protein
MAIGKCAPVYSGAIVNTQHLLCFTLNWLFSVYRPCVAVTPMMFRDSPENCIRRVLNWWMNRLWPFENVRYNVSPLLFSTSKTGGSPTCLFMAANEQPVRIVSVAADTSATKLELFIIDCLRRTSSCGHRGASSLLRRGRRVFLSQAVNPSFCAVN